MNTGACGCKCFRSCVICESAVGLKPSEDWGKQLKEENREFYEYSIENGNCFKLEKPQKTLDFPGIKTISDFVTPEEESSLIFGLEDLPCDSSQPGRRKQNFGPRKEKQNVAPSLASLLAQNSSKTGLLQNQCWSPTELWNIAQSSIDQRLELP